MSTKKQEVVTVLKQDVLPSGYQTEDEWENYIRDANIENTIIERGKRWFEFYKSCQKSHNKQGGSLYTQFAQDRFGLDPGAASRWRAIGKGAEELLINDQKFSADPVAMAQFLSLPENGKAFLLEKCKLITRKDVADFRKIARIAKIEELTDQNSVATEDHPQGVFDVIVIDPPWRYDGGEQAHDSDGFRGVVDYPTMTIDEIASIELPATDDCVLWFWTTHRFMRHALDILSQWGFEEKVILTWVKDRMGIGRWLRSQTEFCIMAAKGSPVVTLTNQTTVLNAGLREHSRKPDEFYDMVDSLCVGRKLDFFSRQPREGWQQFGNDIDKF